MRAHSPTEYQESTQLGGPFIDYGGKRVDEIRALRDQTKSRRAHLFELSTAIERLDALLRERARGYSLEPLYELVPEPLWGRVELVYDLNKPRGERQCDASHSLCALQRDLRANLL
jgi:hypothetical protein